LVKSAQKGAAIKADITYLEIVPDAWRPERMLTVEAYEQIRRKVQIEL